ncbi:S-adenosylmethionine:tRNA ribosyltransferase-isomerase [Mucinivorans hirudinis]|uniref:S-adenosylmethionine:tRNA ribosyltransferase-isomerase n=1 Tax=Mucinivorans hirudinis TaxID=1433126 RepID=A0A060REP4_9BACT|nr:S-adenosylmethionine:tRNA ribosyltransferase-isomerase [Mucinivorans hirudinis]
MDKVINISEFDYHLPVERIAKFPLDRREESKLLVYKHNIIADSQFLNIRGEIPSDYLLAFNNTKVVRARLIFRKDSGARIEIFCLEPVLDYERAFAAVGQCSWKCIVGNAKKWKEGDVKITHNEITLSAAKISDNQVKFSWNTTHTFGELLAILGKIPIPPYLERDSAEIDNSRYQTTYCKIEGSVAAPTAGLHFTKDILAQFPVQAEVTLHVGAGTFLPVKTENAVEHAMHTEHFSIEVAELEKLVRSAGRIIAVGTTTVRTLESLVVLGERVLTGGNPREQQTVGQWEAYGEEKQSAPAADALGALHQYMVKNQIPNLHCSTQIMITPGYRFRVVAGLITNFHQPKSTLLLLISAVVGDDWHRIYEHAMANGYRFLSYGDSSLLFVESVR